MKGGDGEVALEKEVERGKHRMEWNRRVRVRDRE